MKIGELKHNHSLTDLLKVLLFALLMLAPIGSVLTRSLYVICNKNAYQSYSRQYHLENATELVAGQSYTIEIDSVLLNVDSFNLVIEDDSINNLQTTITPTTSQYTRFLLAGDSTYYYLSDGTNIYNFFVGSFNFVYQSGSYDNLLPYIKQYTQDSYLDNVFEYSISKLATDQMFTWTANTPVFTGVQAMCTQLGITAPAIPIIIAYWLILTCVYIVIDIVIKLITYITHLIGARKGA